MVWSIIAKVKNFTVTLPFNIHFNKNMIKISSRLMQATAHVKSMLYPSAFSLNYRDIIFLSIFILALFYFALTLFTRQSIGLNPSDLIGHINFVSLFIKGDFKSPEVGFQFVVAYLSRLIHLTHAKTAVAVLTVNFMIMSFIILGILKKSLTISYNQAIVFSIMLLTISAIYFHHFNSKMYLGQGSPNIWHSPTLFLVKPYAFLVTVFSVICLKKNSFHLSILVALLLLISLTFKPSFGLIFLPGFFLYTFLYHRNMASFVLMTIILLPAAIAIVYQIYLYSQFDLIAKHSVVIMPYAALHVYTKNVFISFLLALGFPLCLLAFRHRAVFNNPYLALSWLILFCGYAQAALLAEDGPRFKSCNFAWGYFLSLHLVFVFSFIEFFRWTQYLRQQGKNLIYSARYMFTSIIFSYHLYSGIVYITKIMRGFSYS